MERPSARLFLTLAVAFGGILAYVSIFRDALIDDAFITLKYAQTLAASGTWGFYPGRMANTATSPLNVLLTAAVGLAAPTMVAAALWLAALELLGIGVLLHLTSRRVFGSDVFGVTAFVGLLANPLLVSTMGLEGILFTLGLTAVVYSFATERWTWLAVALALTTLTRADAALLFAVAFVAVPLPLTARIRLAATFAIVLLPWHVYSWVHLGSLIPDTMKIKMFQRAWSAWMTFPHGPLLYIRAFPLAAVLSVLLVPFGLGLLVPSGHQVRRISIVLASYAILHFAAYTVIRVPPYHWYYVNQIVPGVLVGSFGLASLAHAVESRSRTWRAVFFAAAALPAIGIGILAGRTAFHVTEMPIHSNWATHDTYKAMGAWLKASTDPDSVIFCAGEIGTLAFYSDRYLVNEFSDLNRISESIVAGTFDAKPIVGPLMKLNYRWRTLQPPFPESDFWLGATRDEKTKQEFRAKSVMTWNVSTRFTDWLYSGTPMLYALRTTR